eukprot:1184229-Prorocentrum_minimum.AAC.2
MSERHLRLEGTRDNLPVNSCKTYVVERLLRFVSNPSEEPGRQGRAHKTDEGRRNERRNEKRVGGGWGWIRYRGDADDDGQQVGVERKGVPRVVLHYDHHVAVELQELRVGGEEAPRDPPRVQAGGKGAAGGRGGAREHYRCGHHHAAGADGGDEHHVRSHLKCTSLPRTRARRRVRLLAAGGVEGM